MVAVPVVPITLTSGVESASTTDAAGGTAIANAAANWWVVTPIANSSGERLLLKFLGVAATTNIRVAAGARPPSQREGLGDYTFALAPAEVRYIVLETARFLQADGTISISTVGGENGTTCMAFILPKAH